MSFSKHLHVFTMIAGLASLGLLLTGCAADLGTGGESGGTQKMHYYGGPKSPMWPGQ